MSDSPQGCSQHQLKFLLFCLKNKNLGLVQTQLHAKKGKPQSGATRFQVPNDLQKAYYRCEFSKEKSQCPVSVKCMDSGVSPLWHWFSALALGRHVVIGGRYPHPSSPPKNVSLEAENVTLFGMRVFAEVIKVRISRSDPPVTRRALQPMMSVL